MRPMRRWPCSLVLLTACTETAAPPAPNALTTASTAAPTASATSPAPPPAAPSSSAPWRAAHERADAGAPEPVPAADTIAWEPRGSRLAVAREADVAIVDAARPDRLVRLGPAASRVTALAWAGGAAVIATFGSGGEVQTWSSADGAARATLATGLGDLHVLAVSHDGALVAVSAGDGPLPQVLGAGERPPLQGEIMSSPWDLAFLPDGKHLAGFDAVAVSIWELASGKLTASRGFATGATSPVALSPDGTFAATALSQHQLVAWPLGKAEEVPLEAVDDCKDHLFASFSKDSKLLIAYAASGWARSWNVPSLSPRTSWRPSEPVASSLMCDDGGTVVVRRSDGKLDVWDAYQSRKRRELEGDVAENAPLACSSDARFLAAGGATPMLWDLVSGRPRPL